MRYYAFAAVFLFVIPALAQPAVTPAPTPAAPPSERAWELLYQREIATHQSDLTAALSLSDQVAALKDQLAAAQKAAAQTPAPVAPQAPTSTQVPP